MKNRRRMPGNRRKIRVRTARMADAARLAALSGQLGYPCSAGEMRRRLHAILQERNHAVWVAESGGTVAGWIHVFARQMLESGRDAEIGGLVIDEAFRGRGAGKTLVERAERWARAKRLKSVYLRSNVLREDAHIFYQKLGYKIIKTQSAFRKRVD